MSKIESWYLLPLSWIDSLNDVQIPKQLKDTILDMGISSSRHF